jgi:hypothetical protein
MDYGDGLLNPQMYELKYYSSAKGLILTFESGRRQMVPFARR